MACPTPPDTPLTANRYTLKPIERTYASTARLNLQHYLWKDQLGYLVHPSIPLSGSDLKIADVGTGTGIWLVDLAAALPPSVQLDGFDIDIADCPPKEWLPSNVNVSVLDVYGEIPAHLEGLYDVIQLKLFQVVVKNNDPGPLLRNVMKMLSMSEPGGYLQWLEYDMGATRTIKTEPSLSSTALDAIPAFMQHLKRNDDRIGIQDWVPNLPSIFRQNNLTAVTSTRHVPTPASLPYQLDVFILTYEEVSFKTLDALPGGHGEHLRGLIAKASEQGRTGVAWAMDKQVVVGRKPQDDGDHHGSIMAASYQGAEGVVKYPGDVKVDNGTGNNGEVPTGGSALGRRNSRRESFLKFFGWKRAK